MAYRVYAVGDHEEYKKLFLDLPQTLYTAEQLTQDLKMERQILDGNHILSKYFKVEAFVAVDILQEAVDTLQKAAGTAQKAVARVALTIYPDDQTAYIGFFESINVREAALSVFEAADQWCKENGYNRIIGPIDASIWIKYRLKVDHFDAPYIGEPYNKPYYLDLFKAAGYTLYETYQSNYFKKVDKTYEEEKFVKRLEEMRSKGYEIRSIRKSEFNGALKSIYRLITVLYADFLGYKSIDEQDFIGLFSKLKYVLDYKMVKLAYYNKEVVGFFISVPNYGTASCGSLSLKKLIQLMKIKFKPKSYVMLYMGVDKEHRGLGKALTEAIKEELQELQTPSVGALMRNGKINAGYFSDLIEFKYQYILLEKKE